MKARIETFNPGFIFLIMLRLLFGKIAALLPEETLHVIALLIFARHEYASWTL
jgi:hypothetical protein